MDNFYTAVGAAGREVLIIRDNKVIGKGMSQLSRNYSAFITLEDSAARGLIPKDRIFDEIGYRHTYLRYCSMTGVFLSVYEGDPEWDDINDSLKDTRIVDSFNFQWGMVPDSFKDVVGYGSSRYGEQ